MKTLRSTIVGLLGLPLFVAPALAQDDCRGWAMSCASVEVRAEGDRLMLFAPNLSLTSRDVAGDTEGSERVTVVPQPVGSSPFAAQPGAAAMADDPGNISCDESESYLAPSRGLDEADEKDCGKPAAALFLLALPASLYAFGPGNGDELTVEGIPNEPVSAPGNDGSDGTTGNGDAAGGGNTADDSGSGDAGGTAAGGGSGNSDSGTSGGDSGGTTGGGNTGGASPNPTGSGGGGDTGGGGSGGEWGPYHPTAELPPISQVPEPISTTLFGLGLAGYAAARVRRRGAPVSEEDC